MLHLLILIHQTLHIFTMTNINEIYFYVLCVFYFVKKFSNSINQYNHEGIILFHKERGVC